MNTAGTCSQCGSSLPTSAPGQRCPRCLLQFALDPDAAEAGARSDPARLRVQYFGDYELLQEIARGGMGVVWKARQVSLNRVVAMKMLLAGRFSSRDFVQRFRTEAEAAANLTHPNIVAIHEVGEHEGQHYFSMDYVEGPNLAQLVREQPLPARRAAALLKTIAEAVHHAHQHGIIHRDLKPSNVLLDANDQPHVTDFGLAKRLNHAEPGTGNPDLTVTGQVLGTPGFMPPEQAGGNRAEFGPASDVYSLGALLYFLVTGRAPFAADSMEATLRQVLEADPVSPRLLNPAVPRDVETVCLKCLEKQPGQRYASALELAGELECFLNNEPIKARPASRPEKLWRWCRRRPAVAGLLVAFLLALVMGLTGILWQWSLAKQHAARETAQRHLAEDAVASLELQRAEDLLQQDEIVLGVAQLARMVRRQPTNQVAARRLLSALTQRDFALPLGASLPHATRLSHVQFSPDGRRVATASFDGTARIWEARTGAPLTAPLWHQGTVREVWFSPEGGRLLTFADDLRARLWDATNGSVLGDPMVHTKKIRSAQFSPDGRRVVTASDDGTARIWDAHTGKPVFESLHHQAPVRSARFSADGRQVVTASDDKTARLWDAESGKPLNKPFQHRAAVSKASFSPNGQWVVTVANDYSTWVWDVASGEPVASPLTHAAEVSSAEFSPEGMRIVVALHNGSARVFNARDWVPVSAPMRHRGWVRSAEFSAEGLRVLSGSLDNTARLWDAATGEPLSPPMQHDGLIWSARLSPDGQSAATASADGTARVWDVRPGGLRPGVLQQPDAVTSSGTSPDGEWAVTGSDNGTAQVWNLRTGKRHGPPLQHAHWLRVAEFSPDGSRVATGSADGTAKVWDAQTGQPLTEPLKHGASVDRLQWSPDGRLLAGVSSKNSNVWIWTLDADGPRGVPVQHAAEVHVLRFSPDGRRLLTDDFKRNFGQVREAGTGRLLAELRGHQGFLVSGDFSPDGERVLTASEDGTARIWNARTGQPLAGPLRHKGVVPFARFSRDARLAVTASDDATAQVWDAASGAPVGEPLRHRSEVNTAEFSPDGTLVVTASDDGTARLWDAKTGRPVAEPFVHRNKVESARFSPDGRRVLTICLGSGVYVWDVPPALPAQESSANAVLLLARVADWVLGKRISDQGALENVAEQLGELRRDVDALPSDTDAGRWLKWFFADRSTRTISPGSTIDLPHYVFQHALETNLVAWHEALLLCPTNGLAFAQVARHYFNLDASNNSFASAMADWASGQAVRFAPWDSLAWRYRRKVLERAGAWPRLLAEAEQALQILPHHVSPWSAKAWALRGARNFEDMPTACTRALEAWDADKSVQWDIGLRREILSNRAMAYRQSGRLQEAATDNAAAFDLAARDPRAGTNLIDLTAFYNRTADEDCPAGIQRLAGTEFDCRGWIQLDLSPARPRETGYPQQVEAIPIGQPCRRLHFLQTASFASHLATSGQGTREEIFDAPLGDAVGHYVIHYADGRKIVVPILHGHDVRDLWHFRESAPDEPALVVAWAAPSSRKPGITQRLYRQTWDNPYPDVPVRSLDFVHARTRAVPILVAITAE